jgi:UDP-arabinose 4-epimerase
MPTVLVTGGAGYIGSHTCKALAAAGFTPVAYDNLVYGHEWAVKWGPFERGDILDRNRLAQVIATYRPEAVLHFAAFAYVGESVTDPAKYYHNNVCGTLALLDAMRAGNVAKIVFSSTCATYGVPETTPITEDAPQNPINPYGASKLMIERVLADYRAAYALSSVSLRYFNAAGADKNGDIGEAHDPETHLIPLVLAAAAGKRPDIAVYGTDYGTPDGTCIRDYIHVSDLADAHVRALITMRAGKPRPAYNLGTGNGVSVAQVISAARRITARSISVIERGRRAGDPAILFADAALAGRDLGWTPKHSDIDTIIASAWNWHQCNSF